MPKDGMKIVESEKKMDFSKPSRTFGFLGHSTEYSVCFYRDYYAKCPNCGESIEISGLEEIIRTDEKIVCDNTSDY